MRKIEQLHAGKHSTHAHEHTQHNLISISITLANQRNFEFSWQTWSID